MRGFGEAASERWEEAIPYIERFIQFNPNTTFGYITLANIYAHVGRIQDAQAAPRKRHKGMAAYDEIFTVCDDPVAFKGSSYHG